MVDFSLEQLIIASVITLWLGNGWYLNQKLKALHTKLDHLSDSFDGLREYLYEIDPQFEDERVALNDLLQGVENDQLTLAGAEHMELVRRKEQEGKRTLTTPFHSQN